jgi:very-short-patch-repair endonuclease
VRLGERGVKVVRVRAIHVKDELEGVLGFILAVVRARRDAG